MRTATPTCEMRVCDGHQDAIVTKISMGKSAALCRVHADTYIATGRGDFVITEVLTPGLATCPNCDRLIAKNGTARHGYSKNGKETPCTDATPAAARYR